MAGEEAKIGFSIEGAATAQQVMEKIAATLEKISESGGRAQRGGQGLFDNTFGDVAKLTTQVIGVGTALQAIARVGALVKAEYDNFLQRNQKSADAQKGYATLLGEITPNLPSGTSLSAVDKWMRQTAAGTGALVGPHRACIQNLNVRERRSAHVGGSIGDRRSGSLVSRGRHGGRLVSRAPTLMKSSPGMSPGQAVRGVYGLQNVARTEDATSLTRNLIPTLASLSAAGAAKSPIELGKYAAGLGQALEDREGAITGTALTNLYTILRPRAQAAGFRGDPTMDNILNWLQTQGGSGVRKELLGTLESGEGERIGLTGEKKSILQLADLIRGGRVRQQVEAAGRQMDAAIAGVDVRAGELRAQPAVEGADIGRSLEITANEFRLRDVKGGMAGFFKSQLPEVFQAQGMSATRAKLVESTFDAKSVFADDADEVRQAGIEALRAGQHQPQRTAWSAFGLMRLGARGNALTDEQTRTNDLLQELINKLEGGHTITIESAGESFRGKLGIDRSRLPSWAQ